MGLIAFWSISGIFILGSASWWVATREMGEGSYYIKRQIIWLLASWSIFYLAINIQLKNWLRLSGPFLLIGMLLIASTSFFAALTGILLWMIALAAGINFRHLFNTALSGLTIGSISIFFNTYQQSRILSFINPWKDPQESGYQLIQSLYAIGSGGLFGEGYGLSMQKLQYLPYRSTDFIFAVFAEEFGFFGSILLLSFLLVVAYLTLKISLNCRNNYSKLISIGSGTILVGQSIMHIAVSSGAMPTTGLPFPLISYGGNSLISSLLIAALLVRCSIESSDLLVKNSSN